MNKLFGTLHIILIVVSIALIVGLYFLSRKLNFKHLCRALFYIGITSEILKVFTYIVRNEEAYGGILPKSDLPFHLCSIQIIFIAVVNISKSENLKRFILSFMLPSCLFGGIAAILIATTSSLNMWMITIQYFMYHISITVFALNLLTRKELNLNIKDYFNCLKFLVGIMFFAIYINSITSYTVYEMVDGVLVETVKSGNFMYVVSPPVDGLPYLNENQGWLMYILKYALLIVVAVSLCYIKPIIKAIKGKCSKKTENTEEAKKLETV